MIKLLKSSDKIVRPFKTFKEWNFDNTDNSDVILLEFDSGDEDVQPILLGLESGNGTAPEQQEISMGEIELNLKYGEKLEGTFYPKGHHKYSPEKEPLNYDGTYHRVVHNTIKHLFYNEYFVQHYDYTAKKKLNIKNPFMLFGVESAEYHDPSVIEDIDSGPDYTSRRIERRVLGDDLIALEIPRKQFGEKIRPTTFSIIDYSSEFEVIEIKDDGYTNLITGDGIFSEVERVGLPTAERISTQDEDEKFNPRDLSFGEQLASSGKYFLSGAPMSLDEMSESQAGSAYLYKYDDDDTESFRLIRSFACPFTQNGLAIEQRHDHNNLILKELTGILLSDDYSLNDNFGSAVEMNERYCAIGSAKSHIRGESRESPTGHIFVYERDKGGNDHWGLLNIWEGLPGSEFGSSISIDGDLMAVGSPGVLNGKGVVYIFRKEPRVKESSWNRISDVPEGYEWGEEEKRFRGYPETPELEQINESTTRWKIKSVIPDGSILGCFLDIGFFEFESGSCISGSYESGSFIPGYFESGSFISGSYESGSFESGSCISGSLISGSAPSGSFECPEECNINTFGGQGIITQGTTRDDDSEFDTGYTPHEYDESPRRSFGDSHWVFDSYVIADNLHECDRFGEEVKLVGNTLYVSTPSSERQICHVFERAVWSECQIWKETHQVTREGILDTISKKYVTTNPPPRSETVTYPFQYSDVDKHEFGRSLDATDKYLVIGDPLDRKYSTPESTYEAGAAYVYDLSPELRFKNKLHGEFQTEEFFSSRFGNSVSLLENDLLVGSYCTMTSNIENTEDGLFADDYHAGAINIGEDDYMSAAGPVNAIEGRAFYYRLGDEPQLLKRIKMNKQKNSVRRQYGYSVSLSSDYIYVGLPVIGNFPFYELTTFDNDGLSVVRDYKINPHETEAREAMFAHYRLDELQLQMEDKNFTGQIIAYKTESIRFGRQIQVGNVFYKNGIAVLTNLKNHLKNILRGSFDKGHKIEFNGTHTLYETEILCSVTPNEFNVSTNPTSLIRDSIMYDVNNDGKFDIVDLIYIYKFLTGYKHVNISEHGESDTEVRGGIAVEQDTIWPNSDILLTESEDAILMFLDAAAESVVISEYERIIPRLHELKSAGEFDIDNDGESGSIDAKLLVRYFKGMVGIELIAGLLNKLSTRRVPNDIVEFLDNRTGKNNGIEIRPDFERYTDLEKIVNDGKNLESQHPYATTVGLYSGLELVAVAKLGKPIKITPSYPINFLIKYDG